MRKLLTLIFTLSILLPLSASSVKNLDIQVRLLDNGDALITEHWDIDVTDNDAETEWYVAYKNLGDREISNLKIWGFVPGKTAPQQFTTVDDWDIDDSREEKAGRCGIYFDPDDNSDDPQICWGFGDFGRHQYTVSFRISNLVQDYGSKDGFAHSFACLNVPIEHVSVRVSALPRLSLGESNSRIWAYGYPGEVHWQNGAIVAKNTKPLEDGDRVALVVQLNKGVFHPATKNDSEWEDVKQRALDDGEYDDSYFNPVAVFSVIGVFIVLLLLLIEDVRTFLWWLFSFQWLRRKIRLRRMGYNRKEYYTHVDREWTLIESYATLRELTVAPPYFHAKDIIRAAFLRLMLKGYLKVEVEEGNKQVMKVNKDMPDIDAADPDYKLLNRLTSLFAKNGESWETFTPEELNENIKKNHKKVRHIMKSLRATASDDYVNKHGVNLMDLKNYLRDFIAHGDMQLRNTAMMDDYLVYATLMGMGEEVYKAFKNRIVAFKDSSLLATLLEQHGGMAVVDRYPDSFSDGYYLGALMGDDASSSADGFGGSAFSIGGDCGGAGGGGGR